MELFLLKNIVDNPIYEGFGVVDLDEPSLIGRENILEDITPGYESSEKVRKWNPVYLSSVWKPLKVAGRVAPFNDFPGVDGLPAFSQRACDVLRDYLEPNGELLPLDSVEGNYFFFNITRVVDVLDVEGSKCHFWCDPPTTAVDIESYSFHAERLSGLSIFRIYDSPNDVFVSDEFVNRVYANHLNGFAFYKIWPLPEEVTWRSYNKELSRQSGNIYEDLRKHSFVIVLGLLSTSPSAEENNKIKRIEDELDSLLALRSMNDPYYGSYEGSDRVGSEFRMFISSPDVDRLAAKLSRWLEGLRWVGTVSAIKRYGDMRDINAREVSFDL
jgi:hypothetical protein